MNRSTITLVIAAALLLALPQAEARGKGYRSKSRVSAKAKPRVKVAKRTSRVRYARVRGKVRRIKVPLVKRSVRKQTRVGNKTFRARLSKKSRTSKKVRSTRTKRRVVRFSLRKLNKKDRTQVMGLMMSKRVRASKSARALIGEYVRLRGVKGAKAPLSIKDLKQMTSSGRWTSKRMGNLAKVLRLANYYARKDKISGKAAFIKALKAAGVYKKYNSGKCGV